MPDPRFYNSDGTPKHRREIVKGGLIGGAAGAGALGGLGAAIGGVGGWRGRLVGGAAGAMQGGIIGGTTGLHVGMLRKQANQDRDLRHIMARQRRDFSAAGPVVQRLENRLDHVLFAEDDRRRTGRNVALVGGGLTAAGTAGLALSPAGRRYLKGKAGRIASMNRGRAAAIQEGTNTMGRVGHAKMVARDVAGSVGRDVRAGAAKAGAAIKRGAYRTERAIRQVGNKRYRRNNAPLNNRPGARTYTGMGGAQTRYDWGPSATLLYFHDLNEELVQLSRVAPIDRSIVALSNHIDDLVYFGEKKLGA